MKLVDLLDDLLGRLETDPSYRYFMLDGQMAVVDDYVAARPEGEAAIRRLAAAGRLGVGPWYTLPDEFLVSGETLVRNLQLGIERASQYGGAMNVGYLPDMFGHIAQMPQILALFGMEHAVVWRGVPAAVQRTAFWWEAPDGSTVRAEYLPQGYGVGADLPTDAKELVAAVHDHLAEVGEMQLGDVLWMHGTDHQVPKPWLGRVVAEANGLSDELDLEVTSLRTHLDRAPTSGLDRWSGELRSGARSNLLMGVASNRVDVRQAAARAERTLERIAEPMAALFGEPHSWPGGLLDIAWKQLILNAAHDSVCACSADDVVDAVLARYADARHAGEEIASSVCASAGAWFSGVGPVVLNAGPYRRLAPVELTLDGTDVPAGTQLIEHLDTTVVDIELTGASLAAFAAQIRGRAIDDGTFVHSYTIGHRDDGSVAVAIKVDQVPPAAGSDGADLRARLTELAAERPDAAISIRSSRPPATRVLALADVRGYGWSRAVPATSASGAVSGGQSWLDNGIVRVDVDAAAGEFAINGHGGLGRLVDGGDVGDTYNWCPPADDSLVDTPDFVAVRSVDSGPVRASVEIERTYRPGLHITTTLTLNAGDDVVHGTFVIDNRVRDHRLRFHMQLPKPVTSSRAECAFTIVERGLEAEGGPTEQPLATFPSRRFVQAGGLTFLHEGLPEYEIVEDGTELAVTLLRSVGVLSQKAMPTRLLPAGPNLPLNGSQVQGTHTVHWALHLGNANPYELVDRAFLPLFVTEASGLGDAAEEGTALDVAGVEVSAVRRVAGQLEVRVFNPTAAESRVRIPGRRGWIVDLLGRAVNPFEESVELGPHKIATLRFTDSLPG